MSASRWLNRANEVRRSWWFLPAACVVVALVVAGWLERGNSAVRDRNRMLEEEVARKAGLLVVERDTSAELAATAKRMVAENDDLRSALAAAKAAIPGARVVATASASTGPRPAAGLPRPGPSRVEPGPACPPPPSAPQDEAPAASPTCLLAAGDEGEIRVDQVVVDGPQGARVLVGAASAYRVMPEPRTKILGGPFRTDLSSAEMAAPPAEPGWGAGVVVVAGRSGWAVGPAISPPPRSVFGHKLEAAAGAAVGPGGEWSVTASGLVRW